MASETKTAELQILEAIGLNSLEDVKSLWPSKQMPENLTHTAALANRGEIMAWLLDQKCPISSRLAETVAKLGHISILELLDARGLLPRDSAIGISAAFGGQLATLKWLQAKGFRLGKTDICAEAADGGHLEMLIWLRDQKLEWNSHKIARLAARGGHLHILAWMAVNNYEFDEKGCIAIIYNLVNKGEIAIKYKSTP